MADIGGRPAPIVVVMGVSGVGKTTVARLLAERLDVPYAEADDFHPEANIEKMSAGIPLQDNDRWPWLQRVAAWMAEHADQGSGGVVTCSALKHSYRDVLRAHCPEAFFLHLTGTPGLVGDRMSHRTGHFMPTSLLDSQFAILEPLQPDERGAVLDIGPGPEQLVEAALILLAAGRPAGSSASGS